MMFTTYLKERGSWIMLFLLLQFLVVFIAYIDSAISLTSILYYVFLSLIIFVVFLVMRYQKEMKFYQELEEAEDILDFSKREFHSPFERMAAESIARHFEGLRNKVSENERLLDEEKDELLSWIHEVKTPLTALSLMIDRLEEQRLKKEMTYEWLRIHLLLDQQLHQRRIPFIENDLYIERTDLESVIFGEVKTLQSWCIQKGIGFDIELESKEVMTDAKWLAFIIRQLLTNAVKYSERSDIQIRSGQRNGQTVLEVADTGRGIDSRDLPRIFEKGFTSAAHHQDNAATGMGLYLARKAADSLKIKIDVESAPGKGSKFKLTFPKSNDFVRITGM
jgi:two-component system, OmpR family, bacitracin resistance sensor histidine kinase BceS